MTNVMRPSKKQFELLEFIEKFIAGHGYGPSYREIMQGCKYSSVATVALHVDNLVKKGLLSKKNRSARSLEVVGKSPAETKKIPTNQISPSEEKWLVEQVEYRFSQAEKRAVSQDDIDQLYVLVGALKVLGLDGAAQSFSHRLAKLKKHAN